MSSRRSFAIIRQKKAADDTGGTAGEDKGLKGKSSTIYDIAAESGYSIATVSRILRGTGKVSDKARQRVQEVMDRLNYRPSAIARGLSNSRTNSLGILLPKLMNPNYAMIFTGAYDEARRHDHLISLYPWKRMEQAQDYNPVEILAERRLEGVIMCVEYLARSSRDQLLASLEELHRYMPVVLIGCVPRDFPFPTISYNLAECARSIVAYLVSLGHERIALVGGIAEDNDELSRDAGYLEGLKEAKLPSVASYRVYSKGTAQDGERAFGQMLDELKPAYWPTAVIALNDMVALGCQAAARAHGLEMPRDLSIVGCDNLFAAAYAYPSLTSVDMHQQELGARAVKLLLSDESARENVREDANWDLVKRDSCCPPRT